MGERRSVQPEKSPGYPVILSSSWDMDLKEQFAALKGSRFFIITENNLEQHCDYFQNSLPEFSFERILIRGGEENKHLRELAPVYNALIEKGADRKSVLVAFGGGVIGDFAGFVAATFLRGVPFAQIPTTLLASVDSSVGGKVAVNVDLGKNMVGSFYHPRFVFCNTTVFQTLSEKEWICGLAEMAKHSFMEADLKMLSFLETNAIRMRDPKSAQLAQAILANVSFKAGIVAQDEREGGLRAILNLGHTTAHAIESVTGYNRFSHGEAVARGLATMLFLSQDVMGLPAQDAKRLFDCLAVLNLPRDTAGLSADDLLDHMKYDKKVSGGRALFVLLKQAGEVHYGQPVSDDQFRRAWDRQKDSFG